MSDFVIYDLTNQFKNDYEQKRTATKNKKVSC